MTLIFQSTKNLVAISEPESDFLGVMGDPGGRWVFILARRIPRPWDPCNPFDLLGGSEVTDPIPGSSKLFHP
jgi:hypothetical protein